MELGLASKTAIVTGASIGIGRAIAKGLAAEGVRIVAVARRTDLLDQLVNDVGGGLITPFAQDVMASDAAGNIAAFAQKTLGHVDILVNNAGGSRPLPVDAPDEKWDEAIALNFTSYRRIAHALLPQMIARKWGRIINITGKSEPEGLNAAFAAKVRCHVVPREPDLLFLGFKEAIYAATSQRLGTNYDDYIGCSAIALAVLALNGFRRRFADLGHTPGGRT
jgi:3-oxoacyl-[acyl-carrier protein] reductase